MRQYLRELDGVREQLSALEMRHKMAKDAYEVEVRRLKDEIDAVRQAQFRDRDRDRERERELNRTVLDRDMRDRDRDRAMTPDRERDTRHWAQSQSQQHAIRPGSSASSRMPPL